MELLDALLKILDGAERARDSSPEARLRSKRLLRFTAVALVLTALIILLLIALLRQG